MSDTWHAHGSEITGEWYITTSEELGKGRVIAHGMVEDDAKEMCRLHNFVIDYGKSLNDLLNVPPLDYISERYRTPYDKLKNCTCTYTFVRECDMHPDDTYEQRRERWRKFHNDDEHDTPTPLAPSALTPMTPAHGPAYIAPSDIHPPGGHGNPEEWEVYEAPDGERAIRMKGHDGLLDPIPGADESDNPMVRKPGPRCDTCNDLRWIDPPPGAWKAGIVNEDTDLAPCPDCNSDGNAEYFPPNFESSGP